MQTNNEQTSPVPVEPIVMRPIPDEFIDVLCKGSDRQLDVSLRPRLQSLKGRSDEGVKAEVLQIISDCIAFDLCSGFVLILLQTVVWVDMLGGKPDDAVGKIRITPVA